MEEFQNFPRPSLFPSLWEEMAQQMDRIGSERDGSGLTISEDKNNLYIEASLPGLKSDDIDVSLENGILWIKGEKNEEDEDKEKKFYRKASRSYSYRLALPSQIDEGKEPKAVYQDGVMKITFMKSKQNQSKKIKVKES